MTTATYDEEEQSSTSLEMHIWQRDRMDLKETQNKDDSSVDDETQGHKKEQT